MALPPRRARFCATCGVTHMFRHSRTNSAVSNPLSPLTVTRPVPGTSCSMAIALGGARGFPHQARHNQAMAILHQQVPAVAQLGLLACAFAREQRFGIAFRFVRLVRTLLTVKIHRGISWIVRRRRTLLLLGLKTLHAGPRFQKRAVHRE